MESWSLPSAAMGLKVTIASVFSSGTVVYHARFWEAATLTETSLTPARFIGFVSVND